jgi:hypothetical protein
LTAFGSRFKGPRLAFLAVDTVIAKGSSSLKALPFAVSFGQSARGIPKVGIFQVKKWHDIRGAGDLSSNHAGSFSMILKADTYI